MGAFGGIWVVSVNGEAQSPVAPFTRRQSAQEPLDPARYHARWQFQGEGPDGVDRAGGIPFEELGASAARDPGPDGKLWLLREKCFRMARAKPGGELVADPSQSAHLHRLSARALQ